MIFNGPFPFPSLQTNPYSCQSYPLFISLHSPPILLKPSLFQNGTQIFGSTFGLLSSFFNNGMWSFLFYACLFLSACLKIDVKSSQNVIWPYRCTFLRWLYRSNVWILDLDMSSTYYILQYMLRIGQFLVHARIFLSSWF